MNENVKKVPKMRISTYRGSAVKRGRIHRFAKWTEENYGVPWRTMYEKLRRRRVKTWEGSGIVRCMDDFGFHGTPEDLWRKCVKKQFCNFMETRQMCYATTWKRFSRNDFSELEMKGISAVYRYWRENVDIKN